MAKNKGISPGDAGIAWIMAMIPEKSRGGHKKPHDIMNHVVKSHEQRMKKIREKRLREDENQGHEPLTTSLESGSPN